MNLSTLVLKAQQLAGRVDSKFDARTKEWLNSALHRWVKKDPWGVLTEELSIVTNGSVDLYLPAYAWKVLSVFDEVDNRQVKRLENWDRQAPLPFGQETAGTPYFWREMGLSAVASEPATKPASVKFTPQETSTAIFYVDGLISSSSLWSGVSGPALLQSRHREYVTAASGIGSSTTQTYHRIFTIGKNAETTKEVLVNWGDETAALLEPSEYQARYRHIQLLYKPGSGRSMKVRYLLKPERLKDDEQHAPPGVNPEYLVWWAAGCIHSAMKEADEAREKWRIASEFLADDTLHEEAHGDQDGGPTPDPGFWGNEIQEGWTP